MALASLFVNCFLQDVTCLYNHTHACHSKLMYMYIFHLRKSNSTLTQNPELQNRSQVQKISLIVKITPQYNVAIYTVYNHGCEMLFAIHICQPLNKRPLCFNSE